MVESIKIVTDEFLVAMTSLSSGEIFKISLERPHAIVDVIHITNVKINNNINTKFLILCSTLKKFCNSEIFIY